MSTIMPPAIDATTNLDGRSRSAVRELRDRLQFTRRNRIGQRIRIGACLTVGMLVICWAASAAADWMFELATEWRAAWMIGVGVTAVVAVIFAWKRWIAAYTLSDAAVDAEQRLTRFGQRLRTTLDYENGDPHPAVASASLLNSLRNETRTLAEQTEWNAIDRRPLFRTLLVASAVGVGWIAALIAVPEFWIAAARTVLVPLNYTSVKYSPESSTIRPGESVTVNAVVAGRPIQFARLRYRPTDTDAEWTVVDLVPSNIDASPSDRAAPPASLRGELFATLGELTQDTQFEVIAGPRTLPMGSIRVLQPLMLEKSEARIVPPSYAHRPSETVEILDLKVLEGSNVELKVELNRPAAESKLVRVERGEGDHQIRLDLHGNVVLGTLVDLRKSVTYSLSANAADGMSLDPLIINIHVRADQLPRVKFIEPPEELVVTPTTEVSMVVEAVDDIGLRKVGVMYQVGSGPMQTLQEQGGDDSNEPYRTSSVLMLEDHRLTYQDAVTYYAFAEDNYFGQPRRTTTPLRFIDIRPFQVSFQIVDSSGGCCNGSSVTLEELIVRQRQALSQVFQADPQSPSKETASRLSESQREICDATTELAVGLASRGIDVPTLNEAANHMEDAISALDELELTRATSAEQQSLAALIRARENVRQKLNQAESQCASNCRKFDREQRQKLRLPEKKKSDKQQQLASTRQKIDELAKREREWSQQAKQCCSSSSKSSSKPSASSTSSQAQSSPAESPQDLKSSESPQEEDDAKSEPETLSPAEVASVQEKLQSELAEIQSQLKKLDIAGKGTLDQAQQAAESMQQGLTELKKQDGDSAAKEGERSAEQLEQLSEHLAAMNARDFGQKLEHAHKFTQKLANRQETLEQQMKNPGEFGSASSLSKRSEGLARDQRGLSTQAELLADLIDLLKRSGTTEPGSVKQSLDQADAEHPPREIAAGMRQTAEDIRAERDAAAVRGAGVARASLQELTKSLGAARAEYSQPQLNELMALEEQMAQLQQQMKRAHGKGPDAKMTAGQKWRELEPRLDKLATADQQLADALKSVREGPQGKNPEANDNGQPRENSSTTSAGRVPPTPGSKRRPAPFENSDGQTTPEGFYSWLELGDYSGVREVSKALQTRIQAAILAAALADADQPVPPAYKELVEKYYRALSDDLR